VPFAEFQKDRRHRANHQPDVFGFIAETDDVTIMGLFFDCYPIIQAFVDKSRCLHCVKRAGLRRLESMLGITVVSGIVLTRFLRSAFSITKPPDRPLGIVHS
jgi:hypothetical protein